jgi:hypothetical protein
MLHSDELKDFATAAEANFSEKANSCYFSELNLPSNKTVEFSLVRLVEFQPHLLCTVFTIYVELLLKGLQRGLAAARTLPHSTV